MTEKTEIESLLNQLGECHRGDSVPRVFVADPVMRRIGELREMEDAVIFGAGWIALASSGLAMALGFVALRYLASPVEVLARFFIELPWSAL